MGENKEPRNEAGRGAAETADAPLTNHQPEDGDMAPTNSKRSPAFQFYPADFLASRKVDRMSNAERGIYITLLCRCWLDNGLPIDIDELADCARMSTAAFKRVWAKRLVKCFIERGGKLHQARLDVERKKQIDYRRRQADNAKQRWHTGENATAQPPQSQPNALISSLLVSSDLDSSRSIGTARLQPVMKKRRMDAAFEHESGIYLPQRAHDDFAALHPSEDLFAWFESVCVAWKGRNTGADMFKFWKARHDETWPPEQAAPIDKRLPAWAR